METDEMPEKAGQTKRKWTINLYAAEKGIPTLDGTLEDMTLKGIAVADAVSGSCRISGISVGFRGKPGAISVEPEPSVIVYLTHKERYLENFLNPISAEMIIREAKQGGYFLYPKAKAVLKMPASIFALPTPSQRELAGEVAGWVGQNIETLVQILIGKNERQGITAKDEFSVPHYFPKQGKNLLYHQVNLSRMFDESYSELPIVIGMIRISPTH